MTYEEFRRRIDTMCDILVGAVPSPAGQIDQITYALMYKFMNDIDEQAAAMGGKRKYFTGDYEKYNWHRLMEPGLEAHDRLELYRQAIQTMSKNPNIPPLFRDIYERAFLPFNSASVLTLFLKEIDKFNHGHSDDIGDAYEYLLSKTGSQGDVGQFRTPRHIIKFIVDAVNPTKTDSVLDPACGTAGFLIAAYNHVRSQHYGVDEKGNSNDEKRLTADEKDKLYSSYHGFDIDPTMVRTASVNMYLHNFTKPDIRNHDTLSSEDFWDDKYDVILANPPFMTPKGGIQPHRKFSVKANRAEVLFVDYIANHLKPTGRAGIIVPEGIIFQSGNAYKQLRKSLIENSLYAVVSLPSGVFNPYAGVKTSILLLDKKLAKERDDILFVKVGNDGFSLGAQRRKISGNQLPEALEIIERYKNGEELNSELAHAVSRQEIADSGDYNLSGDRYKTSLLLEYQEYPIVELQEIADVRKGSAITKAQTDPNGPIPVVAGGQQPAYYHNISNRDPDVITISASGAYAGFVNYWTMPIFASDCSTVQSKDKSIASTRYLYENLKYLQDEIYKLQTGGGQPHVYPKDIQKIKIPLPPLEIQREIVAELDGYQTIIDSAQKIISTYKPTIKINPEWDMAKIEDITSLIQRGKSPKYGESDIQVIKSGQARGYYEFDFTTKYTAVPDFPLDHRELQNGDLLINSTGVGTAGRVTLFKEPQAHPYLVDSHITIVRIDATKAISDYVLYALVGTYGFDGIEKLASGSGGQIELGLNTIRNMQVALPGMDEQKQIVAELESEQKLITANKTLIQIYQQKIKSKLSEVWGE